MSITEKEKKSFDDAEKQIRESQKSVDFDVKEFTIEYYVNKYNAKDFFIPKYQRDFVWDEKRQAKFIESVVLGLPIPFIFTADVYDRDDKDDGEEGDIEIVDGSQRIRTLARFVENKKELTGFEESLQLNGLEILTELNGLKFEDFSLSRKKRFLGATIRMIMISDKSDADVRFMMFERINTGSDELTAIESRRGRFHGEFMELVSECSKEPLFKKLTEFSKVAEKRGVPEELVLRFFALSEKYCNFYSPISVFLDNYAKDKTDNCEKDKLKKSFSDMLIFVDNYFPNGFLSYKNANRTPYIRFEAISVGVILALKESPSMIHNAVQSSIDSWVNSIEFQNEIKGKSNHTQAKVKSRIEFVRDKLLGKI